MTADGGLTFVIKGLGDYTRAVTTTLEAGSLVTVEGPYGRFTFTGPHKGRSGPAPESASRRSSPAGSSLAAQSDGKVIDLFHATSTPEVRVNADRRQLGEAAKVRLHVW